MANVPHTVYYKVNGTGPQLTKEYMAENRDAAIVDKFRSRNAL